MRRNTYRTYCFGLRNLFSFALVMLIVSIGNSYAQSQFTKKPAYSVLSSNSNELIISVDPSYHIRTISGDGAGESFEQISFSGSTVKGIAIGAPAAEWLPLSVLVPSAELAQVQIMNVEYEAPRNATLAPVPKWTHTNDEFKTLLAHYIRNASLYNSTAPGAAAIGASHTFRTAYTQILRINPISFDAASNRITLIKHMTVKITFARNAVSNITSVSQSPKESELFEGHFVNGNTSQFYNSAVSEVTKVISHPSEVSYKQSASPNSNTQWLLITTGGDQGVFHITSSELSQAGIQNADLASIQLFGYGGATVPEDIDSAIGELHECAIDVIRGGDGSFSEARFYDPGLNEWYYNPQSGHTSLFWLYHILNPFTTTGHYLLKVGGASSAKRISSNTENPVSPISQTRVSTFVVHESENEFEDPGISREFLGEEIPNGRTATIGLPDLPGYTSDSTVMRPGINSHATIARIFNLTLNGSPLSVIADDNSYSADVTWTTRNWGTEFLTGNILQAKNNSLVLQATTTEQDSKFWLDWVEIFYRRQTSLSSGQIPFYVLADGRGFNYNFTEANSSEAWDVSDPWNPVKIASANGASMNVPVQGNAAGFRQFIAFNASLLKTATLSVTKSLMLHDSICQMGAEDIIVTPAAFLTQANKLAKQRIMGGQATGPLRVAVVTTEDIYREFGYGSPDYTAIRDFMAYMLRHTASNGTTKPLYLTLFANGHCDYRNKVTSLPVGVPIYEIWKNSSAKHLDCASWRSGEPNFEFDASYTPEDPFFTYLTNNNTMDVAVGRVVVHNADEADAFVSKVIKYEISSDQGDWRSRAAFIADDRYHENLLSPDGLDHLANTQQEIIYMPPRIIEEDIFGAAYLNTSTSGGRRKPDMEKAIVDAFNSGSALISWVGHGNPSIWADEAILTVPSTINKLTNFNRLAFLTTATCDFSRYDNYASPISGGVLLITKPDGGAIASLGTSRSVGQDNTAPAFYEALFKTGCSSLAGTAPIGFAYMFASTQGSESVLYYIMGDPTQRIIFPRQYVTIDSINGIPFNESDAPRRIKALSQLTISGHISNACDGSDLDANFNGSASVTLFDAPTHVSVTTTFLEAAPITDNWNTDGPILYHGSSTVTNGSFRATFIVSKDIKFDSSNAKISTLAYSDNFHSALGVTRNIRIYGIDTARASSDHQGPQLTAYIGSRAFHSGDVVPVNSTIIVDVSDISGLNTSTASIGHSFVAWTDDSTAGTIDLASTYVSKQDDYTSGTSVQQALLPVGTHTLKVRAFDALDNPSFAEIEFTARDVQPYALYNTSITPNPVTNDKAIITFLQPSAPESPVDVSVSIFTVIGQKVRDLSAQSISQNSVTIPFDGKDNGGSLLPDGTYLYRITAQERLSGIQTNVGGKFLIVRGQ